MYYSCFKNCIDLGMSLVKNHLVCSDDCHEWYNRKVMDNSIVTKLNTFFSSYLSQEFKKGELLFRAGTEPSGIYYIEEGIVRRYWISENGEEITLNLYKPHTFLPMSWAIAGVPNTHFYEAMTKVKTKKAPKDKVLQFLQNEPDIVYDLLRRVYIGMEGLWMHLESLTAGNSYTKLIASLVILVKRFGIKEKTDVIVKLKMSEKDIANYAGMSRETASRELQKLKKENLVSFDKGTIVVHNLQTLEKMLLQ